MSTHPFFPIDLTDEERAAGFRLIMTRIPLHPSEVIVAALTLSPSARLVKFASMPPFTGSYQLQYYFSDTHPFVQHQQPPAWDSVGTGPSSTIDASIRRFRTEPLDKHFKLAIAPEDPTVPHPNSNATGNA